MHGSSRSSRAHARPWLEPHALHLVALGLLGLALGLLLAGCGDSPTAPSPPPPPAPSPFPFVAGDWIGTLASREHVTVDVTLRLTQTGDQVGGTWESPSDLHGAVAGVVTATTFTGTLTLDAPSDRPDTRCTGTAAFSGSTSSQALRWTSPVLETSCLDAPTDMVLEARRP